MKLRASSKQNGEVEVNRSQNTGIVSRRSQQPKPARYDHSPSLPSGNKVSSLLTAEMRRKQQRGYLIQNRERLATGLIGTHVAAEEDKAGILIVTSLIRSSPADEAGIKCGDVFVKFGDFTKSNFLSLSDVPPLIQNSPGKAISTVLLRRVDPENLDSGGPPVVFWALC
jgi:hypothetical protein